MKNIELLEELLALTYPDNISLELVSYKCVTDAGFKIIYDEGKKEREIPKLIHDSNLLFQMTILKNLSILKLAESINYKNDIDGFEMKNTFDPFTIYGIVRSQYEAFCNFNNIYNPSNSEDERRFKYNLWVLSGLNYRQRLKATTQETIEKKEKEAKEIMKITLEIKNSGIYNGLEEQSKTNILDGIRKREWKFVIKNNKAYQVAWHELLTNSGVNELLENQYTVLSLNSHPSNVSVFQFRELFNSGEHIWSALLAIKFSKYFTAFLISDYCRTSQTAKEIFDTLPFTSQLLINFYNKIFRGEEFELNDCYSKLFN